MNRPAFASAFFRRAVASGIVFMSASLSGLAYADPALRTDFPCKGCLFLPPPEGSTNTPLLVVLHGDAPGGGKPLVKRDSEPFFKAAAERKIAALALMCPKEEGCLVGSYWQWSQGDPPAWIGKQVDAVRRDVSIDADRTWIAGWSGGASFLGYHYARLSERYAAVIFAGGGIPPMSSTCAPCSPPAYFLVGNKNPLHHLAKGLKDDILACTQDVTWDLLPGNDHAGEWRALNRQGQAAKLLDWLDKHPRHCPAAVVPDAGAPAAPVVSAVTSAPAPAFSSGPVPSVLPPVPAAVPGKRGGCALNASVSSPGDGWVFLAALLIFVKRQRRLS